MKRADGIDMWRAGYEAGVRSANREAAATMDRSVDYLAACRARSEQSLLDAVLLELVAALASMFCPVCGDELPPDSGRCDACTRRVRLRDAGAAAWPGERRVAA